jgi:hypothetical protein
MGSQRFGLRVAAVIFTIFTIAHVLRLVRQAEVLVAGYAVPIWASGIGAVIGGLLSVWFWSLSKAH